jgi:hypothetical protein
MEDIEINLETPSGKNYSGSSGNKAVTGGAGELGGKIQAEASTPDNLMTKLDLRRSSHALASLFHVLFKSLSLTM